MKNLKRLAAAADMRNHPDGYLVLDVVEFDGGEFELNPKGGTLPGANGEQPAIFLPSTEAPGYRVAVTGSPDVLKRVGNALLAASRGADDTDE